MKKCYYAKKCGGCAYIHEEYENQLIEKQKRTQKYKTRQYTRCSLCGRPHAVLRKYGICRVCFRELANKGEIPGVRKSSW